VQQFQHVLAHDEFLHPASDRSSQSPSRNARGAELWGARFDRGKIREFPRVRASSGPESIIRRNAQSQAKNFFIDKFQS
jgi:hypothetical protein